MSPPDKDALAAQRIGVQLRALVMSGVVVSPLYAWALVDFVGWYGPWYSTSKIIFDLVFEAFELMLTAVGLTVVTLGGALLLHRGRAQPFSFILTSLAVFAPFFVIDIILFFPSYWQNKDNLPADVGESYLIAVEVIRQTANVALVALAARLYAAWSRGATDPMETRRYAALGVVAGVLAIARTIDSISLLLAVRSEIPAPWPASLAALQIFQEFFWSLTDAAGPVFLFGFVAVRAVQQRGRERSVGALVVTGSCAAMAYALFLYGRGFGNAALQDPSLAWLAYPSVINYPLLVAIGFAGIGGGIIYAFAIDGAAMRERLRALPSAIRSLRNRPLYAPDEDVER